MLWFFSATGQLAFECCDRKSILQKTLPQNGHFATFFSPAGTKIPLVYGLFGRAIDLLSFQGGFDMLVLSRKLGEKIIVGNGIELTVLAVNGSRVRLGIAAPGECRVVRSECLDKSRSQAELALVGAQR